MCRKTSYTLAVACFQNILKCSLNGTGAKQILLVYIVHKPLYNSVYNNTVLDTKELKDQ